MKVLDPPVYLQPEGGGRRGKEGEGGERRGEEGERVKKGVHVGRVWWREGERDDEGWENVVDPISY